MSNYVVSDTNLTAVANAIRSKTGGSSSLEFPNDFVSESGSDTLAELEAGQLTSWTNNTATIIKTNLFSGVTPLTSVSYPNATEVGDSAFFNCTNLTSVNIPKLVKVGQSGFNGCTSLTQLDVSKITSASTASFRNSGLTSVNFELLESGQNQMLAGCTSLVTANFPKMTSTGQYMLKDCTSLTSVTLNPAYKKSIQGQVFQNCTSLTFIDCRYAASLNMLCFAGSAISTVVLRKTDNIVTIVNLNAFTDTVFSSGGTGGTIYVPQALIPTYQANSNWATVLAYNANNQIKAIEGSIYE